MARDHLLKAQQHQAKYANQFRREATFKIGDLVLLSTENLRPDMGDKATPKLTNRFAGPFKIIRVIPGGDAFELKLDSKLKIHPVVHSSLLRHYKSNTQEFPEREPPRPDAIIVDGEPEYVVEKINSHKKIRGNLHYHVTWQGYPKEDNSWEPEENLANTKKILQDYWRSKGGRM